MEGFSVGKSHFVDIKTFHGNVSLLTILFSKEWKQSISARLKVLSFNLIGIECFDHFKMIFHCEIYILFFLKVSNEKKHFNFIEMEHFDLSQIFFFQN